MASSIIRCILFSLLLFAARPALAQTEPRHYEVYPPTSTAQGSHRIQDTDVHEQIQLFATYQLAGAAGGALLARSLIGSSMTAMMGWGIAGGFVASGLFLLREFKLR